MIKKEFFGKAKCGREIYRYFIENSNGMKAGVINYGAILVNLFVPDKDGNERDVVLGYDDLNTYFDNNDFFGATVGPNANRIGGAAFAIDGKNYRLDANDGENNLHSHRELGYHKRIWEAKEIENGVEFFLEDKDGNMGFPGNKKIRVLYVLTEENELKIKYEVESDKNTIVNMTNHTYFNLAGQGNGDVMNHILELRASFYTPVAAGSIPTGETASVIGTPFDFTKEKRIGEQINDDNEQLAIAGGYDHNFIIDGLNGTIREFAVVIDPESGREMRAYTDLPGVQFYVGNFICAQSGKSRAKYGPRSGFCLETQYFPDTPNKPNFPSSVFGPYRKYESETIYKFIF